MKKLLLGAVAAVSLLFGFASCSGDLHDNDVQPLYIFGIMPDDPATGEGQRKALDLVKPDGSEQEIKFVYHHKYDDSTKLECGKTMRNTPGALGFKITETGDSTDWESDFGGPNDDFNSDEYLPLATVLKLNDTKATSLNKRGSTIAPTNPGKIVVYDLVEGEEYTITVYYDPSANSVSVKISGTVATGVDLALGTNQKYEKDDKEAGHKKGDEIVYSLTRTGNQYVYEFIADKKIDNFGFYVKGDAVGHDFVATLTPDKDNKNKAAGNLEVRKEDEYIMCPLEKDCKYKVSIDASEGFRGNVKITTEYVNYLEDGKATLMGNWKYPGDSYEVAVNNYSYVFVAENTDLEFKVIRVGGDYTMGWGEAKATVEVGKDPVALKYYKKGEEDTDFKIEPIKVKGLEKGSAYTISISKEEGPVTSDKLTVGIEKTLELSLEGLILKGGWYCGWWPDEKAVWTLTADKKQEFEVDCVEYCQVHKKCADPENGFGIFKVEGAEVTMWRADNVEYEKETLLEYHGLDATKAPNATMKEVFTKGRKYKITVELKDPNPADPKLYFTIKDIGEATEGNERQPGQEEPVESGINLDGFGARGLFDVWDINENTALAKQNNGTYTLTFAATAESSSFKIADPDWAVSYPAIPGSKDPEDDKKALCQSVAADGVEKEFGAGDTGLANPQLTGMTVGTWYRMIVTPGKETIKIKVVEAQVVVDLTGFGARGLFDVWDINENTALAKQNNGTYTLTFAATAESSSFKIADPDWAVSYPAIPGSKDPEDDKKALCQSVAADGVEKEFGAGDTGLANPQLTGMTVGTTYVMTVTPCESTIKISVAEKAAE